jgi:hypothetical protein
MHSRLQPHVEQHPKYTSHPRENFVHSSTHNHPQQSQLTKEVDSCPQQTVNNTPSTCNNNCEKNIQNNSDIKSNIYQMSSTASSEIESPSTKSKKRKRKRLQNDLPPVRNLSAYMFFANVHRYYLMKHYPNLTCPVLTKILAAMWKEAPLEEKKVPIHFNYSIAFHPLFVRIIH